jgi:hypothetical protein
VVTKRIFIVFFRYSLTRLNLNSATIHGQLNSNNERAVWFIEHGSSTGTCEATDKSTVCSRGS